MNGFLLAIDQGTTSTRAILFDGEARPLASHGVPLKQIYPANGWVEHDPAEIWQAALACCRQVLKGRAVAEVCMVLTIGGVLLAAFLAPPQRNGYLDGAGYRE